MALVYTYVCVFFKQMLKGIRGRNNREHWWEVQNRIIGKKISIIGSTLLRGVLPVKTEVVLHVICDGSTLVEMDGHL